MYVSNLMSHVELAG